MDHRCNLSSSAVPEALPLSGMILDQLESICARQYLKKVLPVRAGPQLSRLLSGAQTQADCLKGIHALVYGPYRAPALPPLEYADPAQLLRQCYGRGIRAYNRFLSCSGDPEYGPMFVLLASREQQHCRILLELLGKLPE